MSETSFLARIFKPEKFANEELNLILEQFKKVSSQKGDYLIRAGDIAAYYYFVENGYARSYAVDIDGNDITSKFFEPEDIIIDWKSFFLKTPSKEFVQCISDMKLWKIHFNDFMKLFSLEAFREVGRTRLVSDYFELKNHTVSMVTDQAKERYEHLLKSKPSIALNVPMKHIATYLGITDTSLSRIRKELADEKNAI